jgi:hypothetical protein
MPIDACSDTRKISNLVVTRSPDSCKYLELIVLILITLGPIRSKT